MSLYGSGLCKFSIPDNHQELVKFVQILNHTFINISGQIVQTQNQQFCLPITQFFSIAADERRIFS